MKAVIDEMKDKAKAGHIERLETGECSIQAGVSLLDILNAYERICGHSENVAGNVIKRANLG